MNQNEECKFGKVMVHKNYKKGWQQANKPYSKESKYAIHIVIKQNASENISLSKRRYITAAQNPG